MMLDRHGDLAAGEYARSVHTIIPWTGMRLDVHFVGLRPATICSILPHRAPVMIRPRDDRPNAAIDLVLHLHGIGYHLAKLE